MTGRGRRIVALALVGAATLLAGCDADRAELQAWMEHTRASTPQVVERVSEPKRFEPFRYGAADEVDPFSLAKLKVTSAASNRPASALQPDVSRRREPLEAFPLDNLKMVGNLQRGAANVALLQTDTALYQVRVGNYVGQNHGRVLRISEEEVAIREVVQDAAGDWVERDTALRLQVQESRK